MEPALVMAAEKNVEAVMASEKRPTWDANFVKEAWVVSEAYLRLPLAARLGQKPDVTLSRCVT